MPIKRFRQISSSDEEDEDDIPDDNNHNHDNNHHDDNNHDSDASSDCEEDGSDNENGGSDGGDSSSDESNHSNDSSDNNDDNNHHDDDNHNGDALSDVSSAYDPLYCTVEKIVGKRTEDGELQYKIRWAGYESDDDLWVSESGLSNCEHHVAAYDLAAAHEANWNTE